MFRFYFAEHELEIYCFSLNSLNSNNQPFYQYQKNQQPLLASNN